MEESYVPNFTSEKPAVVYPCNVHFIGNLSEPSRCLLCSAVWRSRGQPSVGQRLSISSSAERPSRPTNSTQMCSSRWSFIHQRSVLPPPRRWVCWSVSTISQKVHDVSLGNVYSRSVFSLGENHKKFLKIPKVPISHH